MGSGLNANEEKGEESGEREDSSWRSSDGRSKTLTRFVRSARRQDALHLSPHIRRANLPPLRPKLPPRLSYDCFYTS